MGNRSCAPWPSRARRQLYTTVLDALAHPNHRLDAVVRIAREVPGFTITTADLSAACALICANKVVKAAADGTRPVR